MSKIENEIVKKVLIQVEVFPYEKEALEKWIIGKYHSISDFLRDCIRKATKVEPESQEKSL